ncbi:MAG: EAL domain-containing protein [Rhizobiaceae bacterium]
MPKRLSEPSRELTLFRSAIKNIPLGVSMFDSDDRLIISNDRFREIYGHPAELTQPGAKFDDIIANTHGSEIKSRGLEATGTERRLRYGPDDDVVVREWQLDDGRHIEITIARIDDGAVVALHEDVTAQRQALEKIVLLARQDQLTGLLNRGRFFELVGHAIDSADPHSNLAMVGIDLDGFKSVNDTHGHSAGDDLLIEVASRLKANTPAGAIIARLGGDEFAVYYADAGSEDEVLAAAKVLLGAICEPFKIGRRVVNVATSIGLLTCPARGAEIDHLLNCADTALYRAKREGRNQIRVFEPAMVVAQAQQRALEIDLRCALARGQFELNFQPIWNAEKKAVSACEAILCWNHPRRGQVSPSEFIPVAEETGAIVKIGEWVLNEACAVAATWPDDIRLAVNVSPAQFNSDTFPLRVVEALERSGLPPPRLELEITEGVFLNDSERTISTLEQIHNLGVATSMDHFGTGYSSLAYLTRFPFNTIKIDGAFVRGSTRDPKALSIVRTIVALADDLGMNSVGEGVETREQLDLLVSLGCTEIQGYLISKPLPIAELSRLPALCAAPSRFKRGKRAGGGG